ncbi:MAG TPA: response regulator [Chloroflexota bacterium]|nr:response regulator [Chloroflexota bacterium]
MTEPINFVAFLDDFRAEALEHLRMLDAMLILLEREPANLQPIRSMFVSAHSIKGGAAMLDLDDVRQLAHAMEDVLDDLRGERGRMNGRIADVLFKAVDQLRELVGRSVPGQSPPGQSTLGLIQVLRGEASGTAVRPAEDSDTPARPSKVLLVEDSATVRQLITSQLSRDGFEVEAVNDGREALALVAARPYDLIIAAIKIRGIGGQDLAEAIRALPAGHHLPIILMSSDDNPTQQLRAQKIGVVMLRKGSLFEQHLTDMARRLMASRAVASSPVIRSQVRS